MPNSRPYGAKVFEGEIMRKFAIVAAALWVGGTAPPASAPMPDWMSGDWSVGSEAQWTEEHWSRPRGGTMLGTGMSGHNEAVDEFEYMRIARDGEGRLTFWGSPGGNPPVPFRATTLTTTSVTFENKQHDYPTSISYRLEGRELVATIAGAHGANPLSWRYRKAR
jgi:hypothetical protein